MAEYGLPPDAPPVLPPNEILKQAKQEALRMGALTRWRPAFADAVAGAPLLVARLDQTGYFYYLVPFVSAPGVSARLRMNAHTGHYSEGIGIDKTGDRLAPFVAPERAVQLALGHQAKSAKSAKKPAGKAKSARSAGARKTAPAPPPIVVEAFPVWKPCLQSFSAFLPFYVLNDGKHVRYVRLDGKVFDALTVGAGH